MAGWLMIYELEIISKEAFVAYFSYSRYLLEGAEERHENLQSG
jgi:hypothetical protein